MAWPHREILWNVPAWAMNAVYLLSAACALWIVYWFLRRAETWNVGRRLPARTAWLAGLYRLAKYLITHQVIRRDPYAGAMHRLIFWGFIGLLIATTLVAVQHHLGIVFLSGSVYLIFSFGADLAGVAFCAGVCMALWRRRSKSVAGRLLPSQSTTWMLLLLLAVGLTGFLVEGARIARDFPPFEIFSPAGFATAKLLAAVGLNGDGTHRAAWLVHAVLVIVAFAVIPLTMLRHVILGAYTVIRGPARAGVINPAPTPLSAVGLADFRRLDLLQADACLTCGLCNSVCPAHAAGKPLRPRSIVLGLRNHLDRPQVPLSALVSDEALWSCTTCNACDTACPIDIQVVDKIVNLRRGRVAEGAVPDSAASALESAADRFNPFGHANSGRMDWSSGLNVPIAETAQPIELLYWVGCAGAFEPSGKAISRAMIQILNHLQTNYRVLGCRERCSGDPVRRLGEETLWQELAVANQKSFAAHQITRILTHCPHCYNSFRNEYPAIGDTPPVIHHSQWLSEQLASGALTIGTATSATYTFHDPCYLSRANNESAAPRAVLDTIAGANRVELPQHGQNTFCCGAGGGQMWLDVRGATRVENIRASHVQQSGAQTVATACPFCRVMLDAGRENLNQPQAEWRVKDIAELVAEQLDTSS